MLLTEQRGVSTVSSVRQTIRLGGNIWASKSRAPPSGSVLETNNDCQSS